ncbi:unnamed protein product, partial [Rotaria magnacalcarata]
LEDHSKDVVNCSLKNNFYLGAIQNKYRIADEHYDDFFTKMIRPKLVDFVCDERKRDRQANNQMQK